MMSQSGAGGRRRSGFSLVEVMIAALLSGLLLMFAGDIWYEMARSYTHTVAETRIAAEARLMVETLRRDLSGALPELPLGYVEDGKLVGQMIASGELRLCYDGPSSGVFNGSADWMTPDRVVVYGQVGDQLIRTYLPTGAAFVVADGVESFNLVDQFDSIRIEVTLSQRDLQWTYTVTSMDPP